VTVCEPNFRARALVAVAHANRDADRRRRRYVRHPGHTFECRLAGEEGGRVPHHHAVRSGIETDHEQPLGGRDPEAPPLPDRETMHPPVPPKNASFGVHNVTGPAASLRA